MIIPVLDLPVAAWQNFPGLMPSTGRLLSIFT